MDFAFNLLYYSTQKVETVKISSVFFCFFFLCATECLKECWTFVVPGTVLPVVSSMQVPTFMRSLPLCSSELGLLWSLKGWVPVSQISVPCAASALPVASLLALLAPSRESEKGQSVPAALCYPATSSADELHKHRVWNQCRKESTEVGGVQGKLLHIYSLVLTRCVLASHVRGKFDET